MQPIRIFDIIARRRIMIFGVVLVIIFGTAIGLAANFFANSKKAHADSYTLGDGGYIGPNDASRDWANTDVTVTASADNPAAIDGKHTFKNLTVQGTLTTSDYNRYGVDGMYYEKNLADARDAKSLFELTNDRYVFIMRGFINTGGVAKDYYLTSETDGTVSGHPDSFRVDDTAVMRFYPAVSESTEKSADLFTGEVGYAMTNYGSIYDGTNGKFQQYSDALTSAGSPILPFELVYANSGGGQHYFGVSTCAAACSTTIGNHTFVRTVDNETTFAGMPDGSIETYQAWQGSRTDTDVSAVKQDLVNIFNKNWTISKADLISGVSAHRKNNLYEDYYFADNYNFFSDPKVYLQNDKNMLDSPVTVALSDDQQYQWSSAVGDIKYAFFLPKTDWYTTSPLARRGNANAGFPIIAQSLFRTMHNLPSTAGKRTEITVTETLSILGTGRINVNGKGFANSFITASGGRTRFGAGPGAGYGDHNSSPAASHAGLGGGQNDATVRYDNAVGNQPTLPGSAGGFNSDDMGCAYRISVGYLDTLCIRGIDYYLGFGGGYISLSANVVNLSPGSAITANSTAGRSYQPTPGGSGGAIIIQDADSGSQYGGAIEAMGAGSDESEDHTISPGGGGSIYIATSSGSVAGLRAKENTALAPSFYNASDWFRNNRPGQFDVLKISASGGDSERGVDGSYGIVNIVGSQPPMAGIHKIIDKIYPLDGTSPYNLKPADKIRVTLHVTNLVAGQPITIRDEFFSDGTAAGISKFTLIASSNDCKTHLGGASVDLSSCTMTPSTSDISWTFTPAAGQETVDLQYSLLVK